MKCPLCRSDMKLVYRCKNGKNEIWECPKKHWHRTQPSIQYPSGWKIVRGEKFLVGKNPVEKNLTFKSAEINKMADFKMYYCPVCKKFLAEIKTDDFIKHLMRHGADDLALAMFRIQLELALEKLLTQDLPGG